MKTPASQARENAISFEVKKDAMRQRQNGDWVLALTLQAIDMHPRVTAAKMGTRYLCTLVELNDDETPVDHKAMDRDKWRALGPARQAGIRCKDPVFQAYLCEGHHNEWDTIFFKPDGRSIEEQTAAAVRAICNVLSRSELDKPGFSDQRILWFEVDKSFQAWKAAEHA
jgi:hypothetical protein